MGWRVTLKQHNTTQLNLLFPTVNFWPPSTPQQLSKLRSVTHGFIVVLGIAAASSQAGLQLERPRSPRSDTC